MTYRPMRPVRGLDDAYQHPNNWPFSLVGRISKAYSAMEFEINSLQRGELTRPGEGYSESLLCRRCKDLICLAYETREHEPLLLTLAEKLRDYRFRSYEARKSGKLKEGQILLFECSATTIDQLKAEETLVHKSAVRFIREKHEESLYTVGGGIVDYLNEVKESLESSAKVDERQLDWSFWNCGEALKPWIESKADGGETWAIDLRQYFEMPNQLLYELLDSGPVSMRIQADEESNKDYGLRVIQAWIAEVPATEPTAEEPADLEAENAIKGESRADWEKLERQTPKLNTKSVEWVKGGKKNKEKIGLAVQSQKDYRNVKHGGQVSPNKMLGIDGGGRIWRRSGTTDNGHVYYLKCSLDPKPKP